MAVEKVANLQSEGKTNDIKNEEEEFRTPVPNHDIQEDSLKQLESKISDFAPKKPAYTILNDDIEPVRCRLFEDEEGLEDS